MPEKEKHWIERERYFELQGKINSFKKGASKNVLILGPPRSGKTVILKQILAIQKDVKGAYVDLSKIGLSPESFSVEFIGNILFYFLKKEKEDYKKFLDINFLLNLKNEISGNAFEILRTVHNELQKIKPNQKLLVENAFNFADALAENKKTIILIDNFEQIFDLNNFLQIRDIASLIKFKQKNIMYLCASSSIYELKKSFKDFDILELGNFDSDEADSFLKNLGIADKSLAARIKKITDSNPYLISFISQHYNVKNIEEGFIKELLAKNGVVYNYCNATFENFLKRTSGQTLSKIILKVIADNEGLRLSEIASRIYRSAPVTKALLERIIASDIIYKKDNRYYFHDSVLRKWLKLVTLGYEFDDINELTDETIKDALRQYEQ